MPREPRSIEPGAVYHLISRFVDREWFITKTSEREHYLKLLGKALQKTDWRLLAFALMSNHVHLAAVAGRQPLDAWIRRVHAPFADAMNRAYDRIGPMFVRGPKAYRVVGRRVGHLIAYIHNNPVRAGVCASAVESTWTSHRAYVGRVVVPPWLHVAEGLGLAELEPATFDSWVNDPARSCDDRFSEHDHEIEIEIEKVQLEIAHIITRVNARAATADAIVEATASVMGIAVSQLRGASRGSLEATARAAVVHVAASTGLTQQSIAGALQISQQRVSVLRRQRTSNEIRAITSRVAAYLDLVSRADGSECREM